MYLENLILRLFSSPGPTTGVGLNRLTEVASSCGEALLSLVGISAWTPMVGWFELLELGSDLVAGSFGHTRLYGSHQSYNSRPPPGHRFWVEDSVRQSASSLRFPPFSMVFVATSSTSVI